MFKILKLIKHTVNTTRRHICVDYKRDVTITQTTLFKFVTLGGTLSINF